LKEISSRAECASIDLTSGSPLNVVQTPDVINPPERDTQAA
jgi:hypothetical protein